MSPSSLSSNTNADALNGAERLPTLDEVLSKFELLIGHRNYEVIRKVEDDRGLVLYEVRVGTEAKHLLYNYLRKGNYPGVGRATGTCIDMSEVVNGEYVCGRVLSDYDEATGQWIDQ